MKKTIKKTENGSSVMWFTSIRARIVLVLLICIILALGASYLSIIPGSKSSLIQSSENNMMDLAIANVRLIDKSIEAVNETMTSLSHSEYLYTYITLGGVPYKAQDAIDTYLKDNASFTAITVYNSEGKAILSSDKNIIGTDGTAIAYIKSVLENGKPAQSDIILKEVKNPSIICCIPLLSTSDDTIGVISVIVPATYITNVLSETKLRNIDSSYAYLVSSDGNIIYHPLKDLIGNFSENQIIQNVIGKLKAGEVPKTQAVTYKDKETTKYDSYSVSELNHWILAITADKDELLKPMNTLITQSLIIIFIVLILLVVISYFIASTITKPIKMLTKVITGIAELNFAMGDKSEKLYKRRDETGEMSRVIQNMRANIRNIIEKVNLSSEQLNKNADNLDYICNNVNSRSDNNSATVQQLLAAMEETSSAAETINGNIIHINDGTKDINTKSLEGIKLSNEIVNRANYLQENTLKAVEKIKSIYNEVKGETSRALEQSQAVTKITVLTNTITGIANQTRLLSLNASIEASRAGEAGKGFAVVAGEIGSLSAQSAKTVTEITTIVGEVTAAVNNIDSCLQKTLNLIENMILPDYQGYISISDQYNKDAEVFHNTMDNIQTEIETLSRITEEMAGSISEISVIINSSTNEVSDIARRTTDIVELTVETYDRAKESKVFAQGLKDIVNQFEL